MNFQNIKVIGFDLDQTLYPKSPEIDEAIQIYLYQKIAEHLGISIEVAENKFKELYREGKGMSGGKAMKTLGLENGSDLVQEALENAKIEKFLVPDQKTIDLLKRLKNKYAHLDIITGSNKEVTDKKMSKLSIDSGIFEHVITATDGSKRNLAAYKIWMNLYPDLKPENFLYIGDRVASDHDVPKQIGIRSILVNQKNVDPEVDCLQLGSIVELSGYLL